MKDNKVQAAFEELGFEIDGVIARKLFQNIHLYMLYNDRPSFLNMLDYRIHLDPKDKVKEDYYLFKFMLREMKEKSPAKLLNLVIDSKAAA